MSVCPVSVLIQFTAICRFQIYRIPCASCTLILFSLYAKRHIQCTSPYYSIGEKMTLHVFASRRAKITQLTFFYNYTNTWFVVPVPSVPVPRNLTHQVARIPNRICKRMIMLFCVLLLLPIFAGLVKLRKRLVNLKIKVVECHLTQWYLDFLCHFFFIFLNTLF